MLYLGSFLLSVAACALFAGQAAADDCEQFAANNYAAIRNATVVATARAGEEQVLLTEIREFQCILQTKDAPTVFRDLLMKAKIGGQMYALAGLYLVDPLYFKQAVRSFEDSNDMIEYTSGDMFYTLSVAEVASMIKSGHFPTQIAEQGDLRTKETKERMP